MFGLFTKKPKPATLLTVRMTHAEQALQIKRGATLLDAVLQQGVMVPFNCRVGACKTCQIRVLEGQPKSLIEREYVFGVEEIKQNYYLACQTRVETDMLIEWHTMSTNSTTQKLPAQLYSIEAKTARIFRISLRLSQAATWRAGQFAKLLPAGFAIEPRCYSMVNEAQQGDLMSFDITYYPGAAVSTWLVDTKNLGKTIQIEAPFGDFGQQIYDPIRQETPLLCIAGGSGLGSISGIIRQALQAKNSPQRPIVLVVGAREQSELYEIAELRAMAAEAHSALHLEVVLDREPNESNWRGRRGYIAEHLSDILQELKQNHARFVGDTQSWQALLCGPPPLVDSALHCLQEMGMPRAQIGFDKYEQSVTNLVSN